jgi:hypothetical protein
MIEEEEVDKSIKNEIQSLLSENEFKSNHSQKSLDSYDKVKKLQVNKPGLLPSQNSSVISYDLK